jgi:hypothetical protein
MEQSMVVKILAKKALTSGMAFKYKKQMERCRQITPGGISRVSIEMALKRSVT